MMTPKQIEDLLSQNLEGAEVNVLDPMNDGIHLSATITSSAFEGKNRVTQHRMVNDILKPYFDDGSLHALQFKTIAPQKS